MALARIFRVRFFLLRVLVRACLLLADFLFFSEKLFLSSFERTVEGYEIRIRQAFNLQSMSSLEASI